MNRMEYMNSLILKLIALTTMIIDHYGAIFQPGNLTFRLIGRLAFPIYCFLLVEGFFHTKDVKKYSLRLFLFALISELPFDYAFFGGIYWGHQNIFFTLFIGLIAMILLEKSKDGSYITKLLVGLSAAFIATVLSTDYAYIGIIYILAFYYTHWIPSLKRLTIVAAIMFLTNMIGSSGLQQYSLLALIPLMMYNNKQGLKNKILQLSFYAAYPLHLLLFAILK
ncbi:MAG TPA: TraX protein [Tissierellales bacterium]|uniref:TraX family protein n=2 Tax=Gudongella oleilytica TaxID=1582259 RepID=UPI000EBC21D4|nr:TraX family protein [Gudongella oleilytica]HCO18035.1 TraX protein [Tissierellales bacterium]